MGEILWAWWSREVLYIHMCVEVVHTGCGYMQEVVVHVGSCGTCRKWWYMRGVVVHAGSGGTHGEWWYMQGVAIHTGCSSGTHAEVIQERPLLLYP